MNNNLYQGWYPKPRTAAEIIWDNIERMQRDERKLLALMDEHENTLGYYADNPEARDIECDNLAYIYKMMDYYDEVYGDLVKEGTPRPTRLRMERAARVVVCDARRVEVRAC